MTRSRRSGSRSSMKATSTIDRETPAEGLHQRADELPHDLDQARGRLDDLHLLHASRRTRETGLRLSDLGWSGDRAPFRLSVMPPRMKPPQMRDVLAQVQLVLRQLVREIGELAEDDGADEAHEAERERRWTRRRRSPD